MASPFSLTLRLKSLGATALATAGIAAFTLAPIGAALRLKALRQPAGGSGTPAPSWSVYPSISGSPQVGQTVTGSDGTISNGTAQSRTWLRNGTPIPGATATTYQLVTADTGAAITFRVIATGAGGTTTTTSDPIGPIGAAPAAPAPTISMGSNGATFEGNSGTQVIGNTVTVNRDGVTGALVVNLIYSGTATAGVDYATPPSSVTIPSGQNSVSFNIVINGDTVPEASETVVIDAALAAYPESVTSRTITLSNDDNASTPAPVFSVQPSISPTSGAVGDTFTASNGTASNATSYTRRWLLNSIAIGTGASVVPDGSGPLVLEVTATGPGGSTVATATLDVADAGIEPPVVVLGSNITYPPPLSVETDINFSGQTGDVLRFQASTSIGFGSPFINVTLSLGDYSTSSFEITGLGSIVSPAETYFRARIERGGENSAWSAIVKHGDVTAPALTLPTGSSSGVGVTTDDDDGTLYYTILPASVAAPAADKFLAGTTAGITSGANDAPTVGVNTFPVGTIDASLSSVSDVASGATGAVLSATVAGGVGTLYAYVSTSATPPSDSDLIAGTGAVTHASQAVTSVGLQTVLLGGLSPTTAYFGHFLFVPSGSYKAHFFQKDLSGNESTVVSTSSFTITSPNVRASGNGFTTAAPTPAPQFDPAQIASGLALSNSDRTLDDTVGGAWRLAMGTTARNASTDARCYSVLINHVASQPAVGIANEGVPLNSPVSGSAVVSIYTSTGTVTYNNSGLTGYPTYTDGDVITVVVKSNQLWFLKNGVSIQGVPGVSGGFFLNGADVVPFCGLTAIGDQITLTTTASPPAGVTEWEA